MHTGYGLPRDAKHAPRDYRDAFFLQQALGKLHVGEAGRFYRGERIEGTFRDMAGQPDPVRPGNKHVAARTGYR